MTRGVRSTPTQMKAFRPDMNSQEGSLTMATILIIEDEDMMRVLLRSALQAAGYEVAEAANGRRDWRCTARGRRT